MQSANAFVCSAQFFLSDCRKRTPQAVTAAPSLSVARGSSSSRRRSMYTLISASQCMCIIRANSMIYDSQ
uniref:Uncharacterized protein n=1 Tax=Pristionchus pacificus TaxID=54126 RepID=A0A2A6B732_PRIPA|eukprot:PDM61685.1 hypothetical protein PRIPAC_51127 [Pristionchus pacificus]